jgi:hypothetical protein
VFFINILGLIDATNNTLIQWQRSQETAEKWFLENKTMIEDNITKCEEIILKLRE